jgi:hypothetical protein
MASSFSTDLKLELMVTGENSGTWGDKTNTNLNLLQQAIAGYQSIALTSTNTTLVMTDATISNARNAVIEFTGTITANATVFVASGIEKTYTIKNSTTGAFTLALNQVGGSSVIWGTTDKKIKQVYLDGTNANTIDLSTLGGQISTSTSLADFVVGPNELDTSSVTSVKIASFAVTSGALDTASVTSVKIASAAVGPTQLQNTSVTAGSFTVASITVDAQGRITAASSGTAAVANFKPNLVANSGTGTLTSSAGTTKSIIIFAAGGGGAGGGRDSMTGGNGGSGGFGIAIANGAATSAPYSIGGGGNGGNGPPAMMGVGNAGGAGSATTFTYTPGTPLTANGGNGGNGGNVPAQGSSGNAGTAPGLPPVFGISADITNSSPGKTFGNALVNSANIAFAQYTMANSAPEAAFTPSTSLNPISAKAAGGVAGGGGSGPGPAGSSGFLAVLSNYT